MNFPRADVYKRQHNAHAFDIRFLKAAAKRSGISFEPTYIDTLTMAQAMYPGLHNYKPVSYTHLDVYKRQILDRFDSVMFIAPFVTMVVIAVF